MSTYRHEVTEIAPKTWCISEFKLVNAFLAEGNDRAALIDTGCGIGNIGSIVRELTDKPLVVLLTHGHADHIGGIYTLPGCSVYMNSQDKRFLSGMPADNSFRRFYIETRGPIRFPGEGHVEGLLSLLPNPEPDPVFPFIPAEEGNVFDLGGRRLTAIHTPGHSPGSLCFLDDTTRILFSGDTVNNSIILMRQPNNSTTLIQQYHDTLEKMWTRSYGYDHLAIGHDGMLIPKETVKDYLDLTEGLLNGTIIGAYEESGFRKGDVARLGRAELWYQCDA